MEMSWIMTVVPVTDFILLPYLGLFARATLACPLRPGQHRLWLRRFAESATGHSSRSAASSGSSAGCTRSQKAMAPTKEGCCRGDQAAISRVLYWSFHRLDLAAPCRHHVVPLLRVPQLSGKPTPRAANIAHPAHHVVPSLSAGGGPVCAPSMSLHTRPVYGEKGVT